MFISGQPERSTPAVSSCVTPAARRLVLRAWRSTLTLLAEWLATSPPHAPLRMLAMPASCSSLFTSTAHFALASTAMVLWTSVSRQISEYDKKLMRSGMIAHPETWGRSCSWSKLVGVYGREGGKSQPSSSRSYEP